MSRYDVILLGSSPNALAAAARLAKEKLRVLVLEPRANVGGPVATEAFAPGFRADMGVMSASLDPEVASALGLSVDVLRRDRVTSLGPSPVTLSAPPELPRALSDAVDLLRAIYRTDPPDVPVVSAVDAARLGELGSHLGGLGPRGMHEVLRLVFMSARDCFEELGCSETVRALLAGVAVRGLSSGPFAQGTLFGYLHHCAVDDGLFRSTVRGGLQGLAQGLAVAAQGFGAEIRTGVGPVRVEIDRGTAVGVRAADGERIDADAVVSDHDARTTFTRLVSPTELDPEDNRAIRALRYRGSVARVHLALRELPRFSGLESDALGGTLVVGPSIAYLERAWDQGKRGTIPDHPYLEFTLPTVRDPSLAPEGQHVLDAWVQWVPYGTGDREAVADLVVARLSAFAPELSGAVLHRHVSLPEDLESRFGLTEGHLYGGEIRLEQAFFLRPIPGHARHETPIGNLYLGGSAAHPPGYGGRAGWNLAGLLLAGQPVQGAKNPPARDPVP